MTSTSDPLLQPLRLKTLTLKNRVMSTAHAPAYVEDGLPQLRYQLYHEEKAKGGLALTMFGGSSTVAIRERRAFRPDRHQPRPHHPRPAAVLGPHPRPWLCPHGPDHPWAGAPAGTWRTGCRPWPPRRSASCSTAPSPRSWSPRTSPASSRPTPLVPAGPGRRPRRRRADRLGQPPDQFWSPTVNHRSDGYGGSLQNRMRFSLEVLEAMRRGGGRRLRRGPAHVGRRDAGRRALARGDDRDRRHPRAVRPHRLPQHRPRARHDRPRHLRADPTMGQRPAPPSPGRPRSGPRPASSSSTPPA